MILLTAFEPFLTEDGTRLATNPTMDLAAEVARRLPDVATLVLPVAYDATRVALLDAFERLQPRIWVGLGLASTRTRLELEAVALNVEHAERDDNAGARPIDRPILPGAPLALRTRLDVHAHAARLSALGLPVGVSFHAGTFLCNQALYLGCHAAETTGVPALAVFVHVPSPAAVPLEVGVAAIIELLAALG